MRAISYTEAEKNVVHFIYDKVAFNEWDALGKKDGNVGSVLIKRDYNTKVDTFLCYGTIENPVRDRYSMNIFHCNLYDGDMLSPEEIVRPSKIVTNKNLESFRLTFLDLSSYDNKKRKHINNWQDAPI